MTYNSHIQVLGAIPDAPARGAADNAPIASTDAGGGLTALFCIFLVLLALPTETGAWYWAGAHNAAVNVSGVKSVIPQYTLWAILPFAVMLHINSFGLKYYKRSVGLFFPFLIIGLISSFQGVFPINSLRSVIFWLAGSSVCVVAAGGLSQRQAAQLLFYVIFLELTLSIVLALLFKSAGLDHDGRLGGGGVTWRGVFPNRIELGGVAGWGLLLTIFRKEVGLIPAAGMLVCSTLCLYEAHAVGALIAAAGSVAFAVAVVVLRQAKIPTLSKTLILGLGSIAGVIAIVFLMPLIFKALHRDVTLAGRTEIWQAYLPRALEHPILGQGPGSFTTPSPITVELFFRFVTLGAIRTPHNMYIAALGECGVPGLIAMVGALFYISFVLPFRTSNATSLICSAGAMLVMVNGLAETDLVFIAGPSLFMLMMLLSIRGDVPTAKKTDVYSTGTAITVRA